jgi:UDP-4-amino-4,6-dideoxy-N-acetyl-beta-L-altrosamine N-acetyltransferase
VFAGFMSVALSKDARVAMILYQDLDPEGLARVLSWRNDPLVACWMRRKEAISMDEHRSFATALREDSSKAYYEIQIQGEPIGVLDFYGMDRGRNQTFYGYFLKPALLGSGFGLLMEFLAADKGLLDMGCQTIRAETHPENHPARNLHQRFGFIEAGVGCDGLILEDLECEVWKRKRSSLLALVERILG